MTGKKNKTHQQKSQANHHGQISKRVTPQEPWAGPSGVISEGSYHRQMKAPRIITLKTYRWVKMWRWETAILMMDSV